MTLSGISVLLLLSLSELIGVGTAPPTESTGWVVTQKWDANQQYADFVAVSSTFAAECTRAESAYVQFPMIIHAAQQVRLDGVLIHQVNAWDFSIADQFYSSPIIRCDSIKQGRTLEWRVRSYSKYFARFSHFPRISKTIPLTILFSTTSNVIAGGALLIMALICSIIFSQKVNPRLTASLVLSNASMAVYFIGSMASSFGIKADMLTMHKMADIGVWCGLLFFANCLRHERLIGIRLYYIYLAHIMVAVGIIIAGSSGDVVQLGTTIPMGMTIFYFGYCMFNAFISLIYEHMNRLNIMRFISLFIFTVCLSNEIFVVTGLISFSPLLSVGVVGSLTFFLLAVQEQISQTYVERDYLRSNLENEVRIKTEDIRKQSEALETAMTKLKATQGELIQAEKLASLGTLSAGIAHEINNALNYVNGSIPPMEKIVAKIGDDALKQKARQFLALMKNGLDVTLKIISSLRNYTGLNQENQRDVKLIAVVETVQTIIKSKISDGIELIVSVDHDLTLFTNVVSLNQILMNLVSNAIDSISGRGTITVKAVEDKDCIVITVSDNGSGIPIGIQTKIFDPFFTTKDVGKGTGLGLYIVKKELEKLGGSVSIVSEEAKGTSFILRLPSGQHERELRP